MPVDMPVASITVHNHVAQAVLEAGTNGSFYTDHVEPIIRVLSQTTPDDYRPAIAADLWRNITYDVIKLVSSRYNFQGTHKMIARYLEYKYRGEVFEAMTPKAYKFSYIADSDLISTQEF